MSSASTRFMFAGAGERIELDASAHRPARFARGALQAAAWLVGRPPGLYSMQDVSDLADSSVVNPASRAVCRESPSSDVESRAVDFAIPQQRWRNCLSAGSVLQANAALSACACLR